MKDYDTVMKERFIRDRKIVTSFYTGLLVFACFLVIGYGIDIVQVIKFVFSSQAVDHTTWKQILEIIGIFVPPWGAVMGWLSIIF